MSNSIELYIRHNGDCSFLRIFGNLLDLVNCDLSDEPVAHLELAVMPEWITDAEQRQDYIRRGEILHVRVPINQVHAISK